MRLLWEDSREPQTSSIKFSEGLREMTDIHIPDRISGLADRCVFIIQ